MPTYRLFKLDYAGKYAAGEEMNALDDDEAMKQARAVGHAFTCELWLGRRLVGRIVAPQG
jgi:hypothetical protein